MTVYGPENCPKNRPKTAHFDMFWLIGPALVPPRSTGQIGRESR
jgi:hypothetical protein